MHSKGSENTTALFPGQDDQDRADICAKMCCTKLRGVTAFNIDEKVFEENIAYVRVSQFQKRGLPNAHGIFILYESAKVAPMQSVHAGAMTSAEFLSF